MIIGEHAVIPENVDSGQKEWLASIPIYRVSIRLIDGVTLEQFTPNEKEADRLLRLIDKAIEQGAAARETVRMNLSGDDFDE